MAYGTAPKIGLLVGLTDVGMDYMHLRGFEVMSGEHNKESDLPPSVVLTTPTRDGDVYKGLFYFIGKGFLVGGASSDPRTNSIDELLGAVGVLVERSLDPDMPDIPTEGPIKVYVEDKAWLPLAKALEDKYKPV